jgi:hypothetical protein
LSLSQLQKNLQNKNGNSQLYKTNYNNSQQQQQGASRASFECRDYNKDNIENEIDDSPVALMIRRHTKALCITRLVILFLLLIVCGLMLYSVHHFVQTNEQEDGSHFGWQRVQPRT